MAGRFSRLLGQVAVAAVLASPLALASTGAQAQDGARVYNQCKACHSLDAGVNRVGPSLAGLSGRAAGTAEGFRFSDAMKDSGITWDADTLGAYLADPRGNIPGNRMAFRGIRDEGQRAAVIEYVLSQ
jgi:cytochrome c